MSFLTELIAFAIVGDARYGREVEYPCDTCPSDGRCLRHGSCKEYKEWLEYKNS